MGRRAILSERSDWEDWIVRDWTENERQPAMIARAEADIDQLVYGRFELTDNEIALLEGAI